MAGILVDYPAADVRLFFRIFFNVASVTIAVVGNRCLGARAKARLLQGHNVPLPQLTSWLSSYTVLTSWRKLRTLPGGWLYPIMVFAYLLHLGSDYTTALLSTVSVRDRCAFGTGLVMSQTKMALVPWNGSPYTVVTQAQVTSLLNGGLQGVYKKVNRALDFAADASDILGQWQCTRSPTELDYPADVSVDDTVVSLQDHGLLYQTPCLVASNLSTISHLVVIDTSAGGSSGTAFDVRISVDATPYGFPSRNMQSYQCTLNDTYGELAAVQEGISSLTTLYDWRQRIQGSLYDGTGTPASNDTGGILEQVLNSMIMVAGGGNYLLNETQSQETQGCLTHRTRILWGLLALAGLAAAVVLGLLLYWLGLVVRLSMLQRDVMAKNENGSAWTTQNPPLNTFKWMTQAVRESQPSRDAVVEEQDLRNWYLGMKGSTGDYAIVSRRKADGMNGYEEVVALQSFDRA
jgi:hypothetical protein